MAGNLVVVCPECEKKFKPKSDVSGKKIKCPFCKETFVVPAAKDAEDDPEEKARPDAIKSGKPKPEEVKAAAPPGGGGVDRDENPYDVKHVDLVPRCPNCTQEMGNHEIICLACGYNTLTRQWGKTEKTFGITFKRHITYLAPALGSAAFVFFAILFVLYYTIVSPYHVADVMVVSLSDHESMRMWITLIMLGIIWAAGIFCFKKFIEKPKPDEIQMD